MKALNAAWIVAGVWVVILGLVTVTVFLPARRDISAAHKWVQTGGGRILSTACGPIEYADVGEGQPVLLIHGTSGGYVQGLILADLLGKGYRYIVPSRFGYLGTPLPADATPVAQAQAHLCLLDALGVRRVAVWATSAGALSALEMAARAPERVSALVLVSPDSWAPDMETATSPVPRSEEHTSFSVRTLPYGSCRKPRGQPCSAFLRCRLRSPPALPRMSVSVWTG